MSLSATLFGTDSLIFKATNILGLGIPGLLHKTFGPGEPEAQRLGEISRQTAKEGEPRVIVWGRVRPIGGNIIHCQEPQKRMVEQSSSGGGKGGGKKKQKVEHVFRSYAIGVCEGPITGFSRIWRNNKLVYDARGNEWGEKNNPIFLRTFRLYLGGWDQMPDPTLQSIWGVENVPAYRGTAYMVSIDEDLTDQGGMVPQWQFEVERAEGVFYTSKPYAVEHEAAFDVEPENTSGVFRRTLFDTSQLERMESGGAIFEGGSLRAILYNLNNDPEELESGGAILTGGTLRSAIVPYTHDIPEELESGGAMLTAGVLRLGLISYTNGVPENLESGGAILVGGSHAVP